MRLNNTPRPRPNWKNFISQTSPLGSRTCVLHIQPTQCRRNCPYSKRGYHRKTTYTNNPVAENTFFYYISY